MIVSIIPWLEPERRSMNVQNCKLSIYFLSDFEVLAVSMVIRVSGRLTAGLPWLRVCTCTSV